MQPNIVLIVLDTARYDDARGSVGGASIMPTVDALAAEGAEYTNVSSAAPWTLPSHASLFTGMYPSKHGATSLHKRLAEEHVRLPEALHRAGYETVGVSNNTWISGEFGFERGFDTFRRTWQYVQSATDLGRIARTYEGRAKLRALASELLSGNPIVNVVNALYGRFGRKRHDSGAKQTNAFVADWASTRDTERPFFLFINYLEPHLEYRPPRQYAEQYLPNDVTYEAAMSIPQNAWDYIAGDLGLSEHDFEVLRDLYRAELRYLDEKLAELRETINANTDRDTVFIVTADHGENIGSHGLMDHQYCLYETLLHVPLVITGGPFTGGAVVDDPVQLVDLVPTLLDITDTEAPLLTAQSQGHSFHPEEPHIRTHSIAEYLGPQPSMSALESRVGTLSESVLRYDRKLRAIRRDGTKLIRGSDGTTELYDLNSDPDETSDISTTQPDDVDRLEQDLDTWLGSFSQAVTDGDVDMEETTRRRLEELGYLQ
ncbi:sulfatase [Haloarcula sp. GH36]|uniref:sulfatase n=1 Tax=Haloarcula montana TaxID=3111776 RepID=UPI002D776885|nr:sulfatase [Haloarcula sp. GH36]